MADYIMLCLWPRRKVILSCDISMILPFEMRNRSKPVATYGLSVGGFPNSGPVFVPLFVHLINTLSPLAKTS